MAEKYVITIDRLYGSGGRMMGRKLSEELGIPFYDEEILKMASEESAVRRICSGSRPRSSARWRLSSPASSWDAAPISC